MSSLFSELVRGVRLVVVGVLALAGLTALVTGAILVRRGNLTRIKVLRIVDVLQGPDLPATPSGSAAAPSMPVDVALTVSRRYLDGERADALQLRESLRRVADSNAEDQRRRKTEWALIEDAKKRAGLGFGVPAARPSPAAGSPVAPPAAAAGGDAFDRAVRVAARTDPRSLAQRMLMWTASGPAAGGGAPAPDYDQMLRYLRSLSDRDAAQVLEEMERLRGPDPEADPQYGRRVAAEVHARLGRQP